MPDTSFVYEAAGRFLYRVNRWPAARVARGPSSDPAMLLGDEHLALAVAHAAPGLHAWGRGQVPGRWIGRDDAPKLRSLQRYEVRAHTRPTPFGLFVAVGLGAFAEDERGDLRGFAPELARARVHTRPDLGLVAAAYAADPALSYSSNALVRVDADRLFIEGGFAFGAHQGREARIRRTPAVELLLAQARDEPQRLDQLIETASRRYPGVAEAPIKRLVTDLIDLGFLLRAGQPRLTYHAWDPRDLWRGLSSGPAEDLDRLSRVIPAADLDGVSAVLRHGETAARRYGYDGDPVEVQVALDDGDGRLPRSIGAAVADAATFLTRVAPGAGDGSLSGQSAMIDYHHLFLERFGYGAAVRLTDVIDPVRGLGGMTQSAEASGRTVRELTPYEWVLHDLLTTALHRGASEIEITAEVEARLIDAVPDADSQPLHPSIDVFAQVAEGVDDSTVVLNHAPVAEGGTSFGRFAHLFGADVAEELRSLRRSAISAPVEPQIEVQFSYLPLNPHAGNVAISPATGDRLIAVNAADGATGSEELSLDDLWVVADYERLLIWSRTLGREVYPAQSHMLTAQLAPDIVQFALQVGAVRRRPLGGFSWGPFERSTHLPRLVRRGVVIRVAEWTMTTDTQLDRSNEESARRSIERWRRDFRVPRHVYDVEDDNRLLLDLDTSFAADHLAAEAKRRRVIRFQEVVPDAEHHAVTGSDGERYSAEFVIPVRLRETNRRETKQRSGTRGRPGTLSHRRAPAWMTVSAPYFVDDPLAERPGWLAYDMYVPAGLNSAVITRLRALLHEDSTVFPSVIERWYFVQYRDRRSHLRVRFRLRDDADSDTAREWVRTVHRSLRADGVSSDIAERPYRPEYGRYSPPEMFDRFEELFARESELVADLGAVVPAEERRLVAIGIMSLYLRELIADHEARDAFIASLRSADIRRADREQLRADIEILSRLIADPEAGDDSGTAPILKVVAEHTSSLRHAIRRLAPAIKPDPSGRLTARGEGVLRSVLHMTCNRVLVSEGDEEERTNDLWWLTSRRLRGVAARKSVLA